MLQPQHVHHGTSRVPVFRTSNNEPALLTVPASTRVIDTPYFP